MWYNDQDKDLPIAGDAAELSEQLAAIGEYSDRSRVQQDFLRQKATARYWMDQISRFGGAQDLAENLFNNRDNQLRWSSPRLATGDTIDSSFDRPVPWANAGEGPLPDLTNMDMQLDEWWQNRLTEIEESSKVLVQTSSRTTIRKATNSGSRTWKRSQSSSKSQSSRRRRWIR